MELGWFSVGERAISVRIDRPESGSAWGGILIVPSFGREAVNSFRTTRALSVAGAASGYVVACIDLSGDGESTDLSVDDDPVACWTRDIERAYSILQEMVSPSPVHVVGLRLGAALADQLNISGNGHTVLWEPIGGKEFIRHHAALRKLSFRTPRLSTGIELDGTWLSERHASAIRGIPDPKSRDASIQGRRVRLESDREIAKAIAPTSPHHARVPFAAIGEILASLTRGDLGSVYDHGQISPSMPQREGLATFSESFVSVGADGLPGVLCLPTSAPLKSAVVFTAMGAELRSGPGRLWVAVARRLSEFGVASLRCDRRLIGDALDPMEPAEPRPYTEDSAVDVAAAVQYMHDLVGVPVVGVGVCSGAWSLMKASSFVDMAAILAINMVDWQPDESYFDEGFYEAEFRVPELAKMLDALDSEENESNLLLRSGWRSFKHKLSVRFPGLRAAIRAQDRSCRPAQLIQLVPRTSELNLIFGPWEFSRFEYLGGANDAKRWRSIEGGVRVHVLDDIDHSLMTERGRIAVSNFIFNFVRDRADDQTRRPSPVQQGRQTGRDSRSITGLSSRRRLDISGFGINRSRTGNGAKVRDRNASRICPRNALLPRLK